MNWNKRYRFLQDKMKLGTAYDVAMVISDLLYLKKLKGLSYGEEKLLTDAEDILTTELSISEEIPKADVKDWAAYILKLIRDYHKANRMQPQRIEIGFSIFEEIAPNLKGWLDTEARKSKMAGGGDKTLLTLLQSISILPPATDTGGNTIATDDWIVLSHDFALVPSYAGLEAVVNGEGKMIKADIFMDEIAADKETGRGKIFAKSAFCPVVVQKNLIKRYKVTGL